MNKIKITKYHNVFFFSLTGLPKWLKDDIDSFNKKHYYSIKERMEFNRRIRKRKLVREPDKPYLLEFNGVYVYHIGFLGVFKKAFNDFIVEDTKIRSYKTAPLNITTDTPKILRDYQEVIQDELINARLPGMVVTLPTGKGKGFTVIDTIVKLNKKVMIAVLPKYIEKWVEELEELLDAKPGDIQVILGRNPLNYLLDDIISGTPVPPITVISIPTFDAYLKSFADNPDLCILAPDEIMPNAGIETLVIDEMHQSFRQVVRTITALNPLRYIGMSATLNSDYTAYKRDEQLQCILYPAGTRCTTVSAKKYRTIVNLAYKYKPIAESEYNYTVMDKYNHNRYETTLIGGFSSKTSTYIKPRFGYAIANNYKTMIANVIKKYYLVETNTKGRCIVYMGSVDGCDQMVNLLSRETNKKVYKYTAGDPYSGIIENDIIVTTLGKSSTALDIPDLAVIINTVSIAGSTTIIQLKGRLRDIPNYHLIAVDLYNSEMPTHIRNVNTVKDTMADRVSGIKYVTYGNLVSK